MLLVPSSTGTVWSSIFGSNPLFGSSSPIISGQTGETVTLPNGTVVTLSYIPANTVSFKLSLVANYEDNTNQTVFEKSTLPGLAVIGSPVSFGGHRVRQMTAYGVAAVQVTSPLPTTGGQYGYGADADFKLNFTAYVPEAEQLLWRAVEAHTPLVNNGTLAVATMPPLPVPISVVFPSGFSAANGTQRHVQWNLLANVQITAPGYAGLSLAGFQGAAAALDWEGNFVSGCTDCATGGGAGTSTASIGGGVTVSAIGGGGTKASLDVPNSNPNTQQITTVETSTITTAPGVGETTTTTIIHDSTGKEIDRTTTTSISSDSGVRTANLIRRLEYANSISLALLSSPVPATYIEIIIGTDAWLINSNAIILAAILLVALYLLVREERKNG
jgi:hypothetical protein